MTVRPVASHRAGVRIVAHRAGNDPTTARAAQALADVIELDAHVHRGRVELRHAKLLRPTNRLWEQWYLLPADARGAPIETVLQALDPDTPLLVDLKCFTRRAARQIASAIPVTHPVLASTRSWWILPAVADRPGWTAMRSCGSRLQVWLAAHTDRHHRYGAAVRANRLPPRRMQAFVARRGRVYVWGVASVDHGTQLRRWGVEGLIVDDLSLPWRRIDDAAA